MGQFLEPLDSARNGVVGGVNEFLAFKQALPVAMDFLAASGWALLVTFPLAILAAGISFAAARRRTADFKKYRATVDLLQDELEQVKRQISAGHSVDTDFPAGSAPEQARNGAVDDLKRVVPQRGHGGRVPGQDQPSGGGHGTPVS